MKVMLHIGTARTGTTSFQYSLAHLPSSSGIYVPSTGLDQNAYGFAHHHLVEFDEDWRGKGCGEFRINTAEVEMLREELLCAANYEFAIISSENLSDLRVSELAKLRHCLRDFDVTVVVAFRELESLFRSLWNVRVQIGWAADLNEADDNLIRDLWYSNYISPLLWERIFGRPAMRFVSYCADPTQNLKNLYGDFLPEISHEMVDASLSVSAGAPRVSALVAANKMITFMSYPTDIERRDTWVSSQDIDLRNRLAGEIETGLQEIECQHYIRDFALDRLRVLQRLIQDTFSVMV